MNGDKRINSKIWLALLLLLPVTLACSLSGGKEATPTLEPAVAVEPTQAPAAEAPQVAPTQPAATEAAATQAPEPAPAGGEAISQWAAEAEASSEYGSADWAAYQATGKPNTPECGDAETAWASAAAEGREWINLYYDVPVYPSEIHIVETYYPDQVVQVDLIDMEGRFVPVYTALPQQIENPCPYTLSIVVNEKDLLVQGVRITIDQSVVEDWNEIDAVEMIGVPGEGTPKRPGSISG